VNNYLAPHTHLTPTPPLPPLYTTRLRRLSLWPAALRYHVYRLPPRGIPTTSRMPHRAPVRGYRLTALQFWRIARTHAADAVRTFVMRALLRVRGDNIL